MKGEKEHKERHNPAPLSDDQRMELTNIAIEIHALCRIFDHAACDNDSAHEEARRVYRDVTALLRPLCGRLDRLREDIAGHH